MAREQIQHLNAHIVFTVLDVRGTDVLFRRKTRLVGNAYRRFHGSRGFKNSPQRTQRCAEDFLVSVSPHLFTPAEQRLRLVQIYSPDTFTNFTTSFASIY